MKNMKSEKDEKTKYFERIKKSWNLRKKIIEF